MGNTGKAVARDIVEVVATQVQETRVGGETPRNLGMSAVLTRGVVCVGLKRRRAFFLIFPPVCSKEDILVI